MCMDLIYRTLKFGGDNARCTRSNVGWRRHSSGKGDETKRWRYVNTVSECVMDLIYRTLKFGGDNVCCTRSNVGWRRHGGKGDETKR